MYVKNVEKFEETKLKILQDWGDVLAVDKPTGWLSVPGRGNKESIPVMSHMLGAQLRGDAIRSQSPDLFVVHRLDEGTSGVMIFAKTAEAHRALGSLFENQKVKKTYLCVVAGAPKDQIISQPLLKLPSKKNKSVVSAQGKPSETKIRVLESSQNFSLVEAIPLTGRSHQIRVHLAHLGTPLVGDSLYGGPIKFNDQQWPYPLLHCHQIEFEWPLGTHRPATAPLPSFFSKTLITLGLARS